jgi:phage terminase large subunit GpA-like protein
MAPEQLEIPFSDREPSAREWNIGLDNILELIPQIVKIKPRMSVSEHAEAKRVLPSSTPFPGPWSNDKTPYLIEPMNNMSVNSPIQQTKVIKGAQLGFTAAAENVIAYWMDLYPTEIMYMSATEELLRKWVSKRLDPMIDSYGLRDRLVSQYSSGARKRSGDRLFSKEFLGGALDMASAQSPGSQRSDSKRVLIRDEIDGAPAMLKTGEGNWLAVSFARTNAWGRRKKILDYSTAGTYDDSLIYPEFQKGDERVFLVPCPHCGKYQKLEWRGEKATSGFKPDVEAGKLKDVVYICDYCHDAIHNYHKAVMLGKGRWEPTSISSSDKIRSYQLSSLYSPVGMLSWVELYEKYLEAQEDPEGMRWFTNLYLGMPFRETGSRPKLEKVIELRGNYKQREIQDGILFVTAAIDVQQGSKRDANNPARLEMEICGHGAGFKTWSLQYKRFEGEVEDPFAGAWEKLNDFAREDGFSFLRDDGLRFTCKLVFIDSGDGNLTDVVYRFTSGWQNTFPTKGFSVLRAGKKTDGDKRTMSNFRRYRAAKIGEDQVLYEISTNYYKTHTYRNLKIERVDIPPQRPGYCDFPIDYGEKYFKMLTAEEKRGDGSFHCPSGRRNEALDVRVMNQCAADVYLDSEVLNLKAAAKSNGATADQLAKVNHKAVLTLLGQATARRKIKS